MKRTLMALIAGLGIGLLLGSGLANVTNRAVSEFERKRECADVGQRYFTNRQKEVDPLTAVTPRFAYYPKLDTCLCSYNIMLGEGRYNARVDDVFARNTLASLYSTVDEYTDAVTTPKEAEFKRQYDEMMQVELK